MAKFDNNIHKNGKKCHAKHFTCRNKLLQKKECVKIS